MAGFILLVQVLASCLSLAFFLVRVCAKCRRREVFAAEQLFWKDCQIRPINAENPQKRVLLKKGNGNKFEYNQRFIGVMLF